MTRFFRQASRIVALAIVSVFVSAPALADDDHGKGKGNKHERKYEKEHDKEERKAEKHEAKQIGRAHV